jgi:predicted RNase H-like nuclease (RuvC/YqgF family)
MASIHNRKLIAVLSRELKEKDSEIQELRQTVNALENMLNGLSIQVKKLQL